MSGDIERAQGLESFGYTPRQAAFVAMVAVHGGYVSAHLKPRKSGLSPTRLLTLNL